MQRMDRERLQRVGRLQALWESMRETVIKAFPKAPGLPKNSTGYLEQMNDIYQHDAYNALSIEGYQVPRS